MKVWLHLLGEVKVIFFIFITFMTCSVFFLLGSSALHLRGEDYAQIGSGGQWSPNFNKRNIYGVKHNAVISVEVNMNKKTIHYFINYSHCPYYHSDIHCYSLLFGITGLLTNAILELISVCKLKKSTVDSSLECMEKKWI
jgi:hypothetical protein